MLKFINSRPLLKASLTSMTVMSCGDVMCQSIQKNLRRGSDSATPVQIDTERTKRFAIAGFVLHGPMFFTGFRWLDTLNFGTGLKAAVAKMSIGQVTIFPTYLMLFNGLMGALEGKTPSQILERAKAFVVPTWLVGCVVWPPANIVNFMFIPPTSRVAYVNFVGLFWNAILSYMSSSEGKEPVGMESIGASAVAPKPKAS